MAVSSRLYRYTILLSSHSIFYFHFCSKLILFFNLNHCNFPPPENVQFLMNDVLFGRVLLVRFKVRSLRVNYFKLSEFPTFVLFKEFRGSYRSYQRIINYRSSQHHSSTIFNNFLAKDIYFRRFTLPSLKPVTYDKKFPVFWWRFVWI